MQQPFMPPSGLRPVPLDLCLKVACEFVNVNSADTFGKGRHRLHVSARELYVWLARTYTLHSYPELARYIDRNHSTAVTAFARLMPERTIFRRAGNTACAYSFGECEGELRRLVERRAKERDHQDEEDRKRRAAALVATGAQCAGRRVKGAE